MSRGLHGDIKEQNSVWRWDKTRFVGARESMEAAIVRQVEGSLVLTALRRWWWLPLIVVIALLVKATLLGNWLSGIARSEAAEAAGIPLDRVDADGLDITLTGFTDPAERDTAVAAADALDSTGTVTGIMASGADTEAGSGSGQDDDSSPAVDGDGTVSSEPAEEPGEGEDAASDQATDDGDDTAPVDLAPASVDMAFDADGGVVLSGTMGSETARSALIDQAISLFGADSVTDELAVDAEAVGAAGGAIVIGGEAGSDEQRAQWLADATALAETGGFTVTDSLSVVSVEIALNALFELDPIEFDVRRTSLRDISLPTLDAAAVLINDNPQAGRLRVVGHTDSDGGAAQNKALSEGRAQAVVDYLVLEGGVDGARLEALGLGEERLLIDPETSTADKQRNRRIEWELLQ